MTGAFDLGVMLNSSISTQIKQIPCDMCIPYHNHPFELYSDERLDDMVQSVKVNGVLIPIIVQPVENGNKYEILIGHNRWNASKLAGKQTVPAIIKEGLTDEEAEMYVVESNLMQRGFDNLKISEQAAVIAARYNKMFSQGKRNDIIKELQQIENAEQNISENIVNNSREKVGAEYGLGRSSVARLLRVDKLLKELKPLVNDGTIAVRAAVNISYLSEDVQNMLVKFAKKYKIDIKKSEQLRSFADINGEISQLTIIKILTGKINKVNQSPKSKTIKINTDTYSKYFDESAKADEVTETISKALELYFSEK